MSLLGSTNLIHDWIPDGKHVAMVLSSLQVSCPP